MLKHVIGIYICQDIEAEYNEHELTLIAYLATCEAF